MPPSKAPTPPTEPSATTPEALERILAAASAAAAPYGALSPQDRARMLREVAAALDADTDALVGLAGEETRLPEPRLRGELVRTTFQLRLFADLLDDGAYLEAALDAPDSGWPTGPRPDLRRMLVPVGPVIVFAASNFPFAFSVAGGDTAAALAAGCPVLLKAHPGHPELSRHTARLVTEALAGAGAPGGVFALVEGDTAGRDALVDPRVRAGAFTGSLRVGRLLFDLAAGRPDPVPFYGELGSINPVFVTPGAAHSRGAEIWAGYVESFALGAGQFCTKPGLLLAPAGAAEDALTAALSGRAGAPLLNERIEHGFQAGLGTLTGHPAVRVLTAGDAAGGTAGAVRPSLLATTARDLLADLDVIGAEVFGPASVLVTYTDPAELTAVAGAIQGQLTATVHGDADDPVDAALSRDLLRELSRRAGRVLWNGWPTGVSVTHAMTHGGPYPATTSTFTSVGTTSIGRFLRPVTYQGVPDALLPAALRDANPWKLPRRHDGRPAIPDDTGPARA
ncbi:NADP-dependent aldehyde dehydrogenase [Parafrankia irregularis]|uniref:NADP-dependent aldehyde dehydrogenase n=1 Tax=Parafrankia irregularis TaxID=795642 RepID=A0A0S4QH87_9ACTN|nr:MULTISPECIES: aldehyde dehydrogenase (NADP(+)) [Parafrankia]MBE3200734.1 aldehyde dehydrogenase (NADP(+)) [Parafrankia sp. CH37]CUU54881.1 NADP-dependent aldehyde dehydrogenase [Parafrankia irregularis]